MMCILHIEDNPVDTELIFEMLSREGMPAQIDRVDSFDDYRGALARDDYSLILADYTVPGMDTLEAMSLARQRRPELPFIFVSGTAGEELAIEMVKNGATDYVLKQRMERLAPAVRRALQESQEQQRRLLAEKALRENERLLREQAAVLQEMDERKNEFLAMLSHELRNPLAPLRNSAYILNHTPSDSKPAQRARQVIERQVDHLTSLVDDLLDVTRISRGKIMLHREHIDVGELARRAAEDLLSTFAKNGVELTIIDSRQPLFVNGDATRLTQAIANLLQNAAKFTPRGGRTTLLVEPLGDRAVIRVRDTGIGMTPQTQRLIFEPFVQGERSSAGGGLGLGLALAKGLVVLMGGDLTAYSDGAGTGSEFSIMLPRQEPMARPASQTIGHQTITARRVLIIEDNVDAAESLKEALQFNHHSVEIAFQGEEGVEKARRLRPDVVLCDIGLPEMDGYQVAKTLRSDPSLRSIRLIALSGYALPEDQQKARQAGFDTHLAKPPALDKLEEMLANLR